MRAIHYAVLNEISCSKIIPQTILDVGCGNGSFTRVLSATVPGSNITAIDTSIPKLFSSDHIVFTEGSVEQLPFASESFDLVIAALSLHHWKEKNKGISEIYRVLKKDGRLIIGDLLLEDWMSNHMLGRPKQDIVKQDFISIRVLPEQKEEIALYAKEDLDFIVFKEV